MSVDTKRLDRSTIIFVLFLGLVPYGSGQTYETGHCRTQDCHWTVEEFDELINANKRPCADIYDLACHKERSEDQMIQRRMQLEYWERLHENNGSIPEIAPLNPSDAPLVQLIKRYYQLCEDEARLKEMGLKPIISLLNEASSKESWWKLENWAVSKGLRSSFFSVKIENDWDREDKKGAIILAPPQTRRYSPHLAKILFQKLMMEGLKGGAKKSLARGQEQHFKIFEAFQNPRWTDYANYGPIIMSPISNWHIWWSACRKNQLNKPQQIDWENYLENYWKNSVILRRTIPLLKNGMFNQWIERPAWIRNRGCTLENFSDDDIKNAILWRIATELVEYAGQEARDILKLPPKESCRTPAMDHVLTKDDWYKKFPQSIRKPVQKIYTAIDLQTKLLNYKLMTKMLPKNEPLSTNEHRELRELYRQWDIVGRIVRSYERNLSYAEPYVARLERIPVPRCVNYPRSCKPITHEEYDLIHKNLPKFKKEIKRLKSMSKKKKEYNRIVSRMKSFEEKNLERMGIFKTYLDASLGLMKYETEHAKFDAEYMYLKTSRDWGIDLREKLAIDIEQKYISLHNALQIKEALSNPSYYSQKMWTYRARKREILTKYLKDNKYPSNFIAGLLYYVDDKVNTYYKNENLDYQMARFGITVSVDTKVEALKTYVKEKSRQRFPFESMYTRPTLIIKTPPKNANYVDLALSLKSWERGMLLQSPEALHTKFLNYKLITKILPKSEPLSPREHSELLEFYRRRDSAHAVIQHHEKELSIKKPELARLIGIKKPDCRTVPYICNPSWLTNEYYQDIQKKISPLRANIVRLQLELDAKNIDHYVNSNGIKNIEEKSLERVGIFKSYLDAALDVVRNEAQNPRIDVEQKYKLLNEALEKQQAAKNPLYDSSMMTIYRARKFEVLRNYAYDNNYPSKFLQGLLYYFNQKVETHYKNESLDYQLARFGIPASVYTKYQIFPFESMNTSPTLTIETPPENANYVDLALRLNKTERGMLLQTPGTFEIYDLEILVKMFTLSHETYANFNDNRYAPLIYGSLGTVIGTRLMEKIQWAYPTENKRKDIDDCLIATKYLDSAKVSNMSGTIYAASAMRHGLLAAWKALKRNSAINREKAVRLIKQENDVAEKISQLNNMKLFLLYFASGHCQGEHNVYMKTLVDIVLFNSVKISYLYSCPYSFNVNRDKCMPNLPRICSHNCN